MSRPGLGLAGARDASRPVAGVHRSIGFVGSLLAGAVVVVGLLVLTSRRPGVARPGAEAQELTVRTGEFRFDPERLHLRVGVPVRLTLDNTDGELVHDFTVDTVGGQDPLARLLGPSIHVVAQPGSRAVVEFSAAEGAYLFYCSVYRHRLDGMTGVLVVE